MRSRFERDTTVEQVGPTEFVGTIDPGWAVLNSSAPNGGYVAAVGARAMTHAVVHPDPVTLTTHFVAPSQPGPVHIDIDVVRAGGRHSTVAARMRQDGRETARLLGTFSDLSEPSQVHVQQRTAPTWPPIEDCVALLSQSEQTDDGPPAPPIGQRFDHRHTREIHGWIDGKPTLRGDAGGYVRWPDTDRVDTLGLIVVADCFPPAAYNLGPDVPVGWVPTVELTVEVFKRPSAGYLSAHFVSKTVTDRYLDEDGQIWDAEGDLVALTRQMALLARRS